MRAMRDRVFAAILGAAALGAAAARLPAQTPSAVGRDCDPDVVTALDPAAIPAGWADRHPNAVMVGFGPAISEGRWSAVATALADGFRASDLVPAGQMRATFQSQLDTMQGEFAAVDASPNRETLLRTAGGVRQVRFNLIRDPDEDRFTLFDPPARLAFDASTDAAVRRDLCWRAIAAWKLLVFYGDAGRQGAVRALDRQLVLWDNYNASSYSQYPWELLVNGIGGVRPSDLSPPVGQLVLLHPSFGVELTGRLDSLRRLDVLTLEPLGYLRYNQNRTSYVGLSAVVTFPSSVDVGIGAMAHMGRSVKLGYVLRRRRPGGLRRNGVMMSVDLYGVASGVPGRVRGVLERLRTLRDSTLAGGR